MKKGYLTKEWFNLNKTYKSGIYNVDELEEKASILIDKLADLTVIGIKEIDNVSIDLWKDRLWMLIENIGRLPELPKYYELSEEETEDNW
jgi:hypothetical protein